MPPYLIVSAHFIVPEANAPKKVLTRFADHLTDCGLWLGYAGIDGLSGQRIADPYDFVRIAAEEHHASAQRPRDNESPDWQNGVEIEWLLQRLSDERPDRLLIVHRQRIPLPTAEVKVSEIARFFLDLRPAVDSDLALSNAHHAWVTGLSFPSPRPPPAQPEWTQGPLYALDDRLTYTAPNFKGEHRDAYRALTPPPEVRRIRRNDVTVDVWTEDLASIQRLQTVLSDQCAWLTERLALPPAQGWNRHGDQQVSSHNLQSAMPWLTFYEPKHQRGLKGTVPIDGGLDREALAETLQLLETKALPDGRPLDRVDLIFPTRATATALRPDAKALGFARTLYADDDGRLWNINPLGQQWRVA